MPFEWRTQSHENVDRKISEAILAIGCDRIQIHFPPSSDSILAVFKTMLLSIVLFESIAIQFSVALRFRSFSLAQYQSTRFSFGAIAALSFTVYAWYKSVSVSCILCELIRAQVQPIPSCSTIEPYNAHRYVWRYSVMTLCLHTDILRKC